MMKLPKPNDNGLVYVNKSTESKISSNIWAKTVERHETNGAYHDETHRSIAFEVGMEKILIRRKGERRRRQWVGMPVLGSRLNTCWPTKCPKKCRANSSYLLSPHCVTWIKTEREGVKNRRCGVHKTGKLDLSCKANNRSDTRTGDLGVLPTQETS